LSNHYARLMLVVTRLRAPTDAAALEEFRHPRQSRQPGKRRGSSIPAARSTAAPAPRGTTARSAWSSRRTSSGSGGGDGHRPRRRRRLGLLDHPAPRRWEAIGHVGTFSDPLTECQSCHKRFRADHMQRTTPKPRRGSDDPDDVPDRDRLPQLRHPRRVDRAARVQHDAQDLPRPVVEDESGCTTCAPRPRRASSSTSPTW
jgi:hypothetical protein